MLVAVGKVVNPMVAGQQRGIDRVTTRKRNGMGRCSSVTENGYHRLGNIIHWKQNTLANPDDENCTLS